MKKIISIITCLLITLSLSAQEKPIEDNNERRDKRHRMERKMETKKIGYITDELDLSSTEAQNFWPIYNEFHSELRALKEESKKMDPRKEEMTDAEASKLLSTIFEREQKELDIKKKYFTKMETAISKAKIAKLYMLEKKFREEVFNSIKKRMKRKGKGRK